MYKIDNWLLLFNHSVMSDSLRPHELQHARLLCPSPSPGVCTNLCPLSHWYYPTISSSAASYFSCIRVFSNKSALRIRWPKYWSFSFSNSPFKYSMNIQGWLPLGLTGLISMLSKGLLRVFSSTSLKASIVWCSAFFMVQLSQPYKTMVSFSVSYVWLVSKTTGKTIVLTLQIFVSKVISLLFKIHCLGLSQVFFQGASVF